MKQFFTSITVAALLIAPAFLWPENRTPAKEPTAEYKRESIEGFVILINPKVYDRKDAPPFREELAKQLRAIVSRVPGPALEKLRKIHIWVEWRTRNSAAEFHPSRGWLAENGYNPDKAGHVEISNVKHFVEWSRLNQPWMVFHELAHGYHWHLVGHYDPQVKKAFQAAVRSKIYESVAHNQGGKQRAYALANEQEYFAELSEAFFGENDYFPFNRAELKSHDPAGFDLMRRVWGD